MTDTTPTGSIPIVRTIAEMRRQVKDWRGKGQRVGLVPTMGALHEGHLTLVDRVRAQVDRVITTIFVNPTQFGANEDLSAYPRDEAGDVAKLAARGVDLVFVPDVSEVYGDGFATTVSVTGLTEGLCGPFRPGHFDAVATVVCKLLNQAGADAAIFGEKDYQQLMVIRRMARDLDIATEILGAPIMREADGLAMSSRNQYLSDQQRQMAPHLNATMAAVAREIAGGEAIGAALAEGVKVLEHAGFKMDYLEARSGVDLTPLTGTLAKEAQGKDVQPRLFAAAFMGKTRLIDNISIDAV